MIQVLVVYILKKISHYERNSWYFIKRTYILCIDV